MVSGLGAQFSLLRRCVAAAFHSNQAQRSLVMGQRSWTEMSGTSFTVVMLESERSLPCVRDHPSRAASGAWCDFQECRPAMETSSDRRDWDLQALLWALSGWPNPSKPRYQHQHKHHLGAARQTDPAGGLQHGGADQSEARHQVHGVTHTRVQSTAAQASRSDLHYTIRWGGGVRKRKKRVMEEVRERE